MFLTLAKAFIVTCSLNNFNNLPTKITGKVTLSTASYYHIDIPNKDNTQIVNLVIEKKHCEKQ